MVSLSICPNETVISSRLTSSWVDVHFRSENEFTVHKRLLAKPPLMFHSRNRKHVPGFYRVIETRVEVWENDKCCGTRAAGDCFHSFLEFSQTFTSVSITREKHGVHVFYFF